MRVLRDSATAHLRLGLGPALHLRRGRSQPQRLLDDALGEQRVVRDAVDRPRVVVAGREHEIQRVHQSLRAGMRSALEVRRDLADDARVIGELHVRIRAVQQQHGENVVR